MTYRACALILALIVAAVLSGCYQSSREFGTALWTLEVTNTNAEDIRVGDAFGRLGHIDGVSTECFKIRNPTQRQRFWYRFLGEPRNYTVEVVPSNFPFWEWVISPSPQQSSISLAPAMYGCQP
jgi:hypothetical protein